MSATLERLVLAAEIGQLHEAGWFYHEIASHLDVPVSTVRNLGCDPDGSKQKERRQRYQGTCLDCGKPTEGSGGYKNQRKRCASCSRLQEKSEEYKLSRTLWTKELVITKIQEWNTLYGYPPALADWNTTLAEARGWDFRVKRYREHPPGYWPSAQVTIRRFGSHTVALAAAGFPPNQRSRRFNRA